MDAKKAFHTVRDELNRQDEDEKKTLTDHAKYVTRTHHQPKFGTDPAHKAFLIVLSFIALGWLFFGIFRPYAPTPKPTPADFSITDEDRAPCLKYITNSSSTIDDPLYHLCVREQYNIRHGIKMGYK